MSSTLPFDFEMPVDFFEKADAEEGKTRRIGGIASIQTKDRQDETILQRGLDFNDFIDNGWFNDNHTKDTDGVLGYGETVHYFTKGQKLPTGKMAKADGHWVEGYMLNTDKADRIWELGKALQKTNRRLGFSVEGKIHKRTGKQNKTIAKALVRNVAITNCPVNADANMEILVKSLKTVENTDPDEMEKTLAMGAATGPNPPAGPQTGGGAGQVLTGESLEEEQKPNLKENEEETKKSLTDTEAFAWLRDRLPNATPEQLGRVITFTRERKAQECQGGCNGR